MVRRRWWHLAVVVLAACGDGASSGAGAVVRAAVIDSRNLVVNPSFEADLSGWQASAQSTASRVVSANAPDGIAVAQLTATAANSFVSLDDSAPTVSGAPASRVYQAEAFLAAASLSAVGLTGELTVRERSATMQFINDATALVTLDGGFNRLSVSYVTTGTNSVVDLYVACRNPVSGSAMAIDAVTLIEFDGGPPADAGAPDAGADAGGADAGVADAGVADAGMTDAGAPDAGALDAGELDGGGADAGGADAGVFDAGRPTDGGTGAGESADGGSSNRDPLGAQYLVSCGCTSSGVNALWPLSLLLLRAASRRRR